MPPYPVRADVAWDEEDGAVVVELPKARTRFEAWVLRRLRAPASTRLVLDALGSDAWRLADGARALDEVAAELARLHPTAGPQTAERARRFFEPFVARGLVRWSDGPAAPPPTRRFRPEDGWRSVACPRCGAATKVRVPDGGRMRCPACRRLMKAP